MVGPRYPFKQYYLWTGSIGLGNATIIRPSGIDIAYTANPDIFAEESVKLNFGVDSKLWNSLSITFDAFLDKRSGIVSQDYNYISDAYGITPPYTNAGEVTTCLLYTSSCVDDILKKPIGSDLPVDSVFSTKQKALGAIATAYSYSLIAGITTNGWDHNRTWGMRSGTMGLFSGEL